MLWNQVQITKHNKPNVCMHVSMYVSTLKRCGSELTPCMYQCTRPSCGTASWWPLWHHSVLSFSLFCGMFRWSWCKLWRVWTGIDQYELSVFTNNYWQFQTGQIFRNVGLVEALLSVEFPKPSLTFKARSQSAKLWSPTLGRGVPWQQKV